MKAKWTSDGPGMLLVMIMIPGFGFGGLFSGFLALNALAAIKVHPREALEPTPEQKARQDMLKKYLLNQFIGYGKYRLKLSGLLLGIGIVLYALVRVSSLLGGA